jgi:aspartate/tyrosine/aromatic aminotransferase
MLCSVLCEDEKQAVAVKSQLQQLARPMYSNPPVHGALVVSTILSDPQLKKLWLKEVKVDYHSTILWLFFFFFFNWHDIVCFSG